MSKEHKVTCRCGQEMLLCCQQADCGHYYAQYECDCGWCSPQCEACTESEAIDSAYAAATATPPNLPLVLSQIKALPRGAAIWMYSREEQNVFMVEAATIKQRDYKDRALLEFYQYKPTPEDIAAARAGV